MASRKEKEIALKLIQQGPHKQENTPRRVRGLFGGYFIFDTTKAQHIWEHPYYPQLFIPKGAIRAEKFEQGDSVDSESSAFLCTISSGTKKTDRVVSFEKGPLAGLVRVEFSILDAWFEDDQRMYGHPRDPYKRIDILPSSRKIRVEVAGVIVAESDHLLILYETMLRPRYYLPPTSAQWQYLTPSATRTLCPYKGEAEYYNIVIDGNELNDLVWWYRYPTSESALIAGHLCFYSERENVSIYIDGEEQAR